MVQKTRTFKVKKASKTVSDEQKITSKTISTPTLPLSSSLIPATLMSAEQRHQMIAEAAYAIAEQRDFKGEASLDDWLQAEVDVDNRMANSK
ncbi:MAG: DUF2934 domain-containing protein [Gammaproteobacteria bacterium]|nr:DUF2934 domain-containing protein [Gammaproteobacteria bacterium]